MNVFLVEDAIPIRERLRITVEEAGAHVVGEAATEADAVLGLRETQPDVAVVDLRLAEGNGVEVVRNIKQSNPETVVVVMTNYSDDQYRQTCQDLGAEFFLDKTVDFERFAELMEILNHFTWPCGKRQD
jgi:DNA-binding NarL/FixJ family response regulator